MSIKRPLAVAVSNSSVRLFDAHAALFQFGDGLQSKASIAAQAVEAIDQELIKAVQAGIGEDAGASRTEVKGHCAGDSIIGINGADVELVQSAEAFGELALGGDGLALALLLGGDAQVEGDGHAHPCVARRGGKGKFAEDV